MELFSWQQNGKIFEVAGPGDTYCNVLTLARCLVATKLLYHSPPHLVKGQNTSWKACGVRQGQGEITRWLWSWAKETWLGEINFNSLAIKTGRWVSRSLNKPNLQNTLSCFPRLSFTSDCLCLHLPGDIGGWGVGLPSVPSHFCSFLLTLFPAPILVPHSYRTSTWVLKCFMLEEVIWLQAPLPWKGKPSPGWCCKKPHPDCLEHLKGCGNLATLGTYSSASQSS